MNFKIILLAYGVPLITSSLSYIYSIKEIKSDIVQVELEFFANDS